MTKYLLLGLSLIVSATLLAQSTPTMRDGYLQYDKVEAEDFSWVAGALKKEPAYKSDKVKYARWALGGSGKDLMTVVWDESGGPGTGYDIVYVDKNFNGDLTEEGEAVKIETSKDKRGTEHFSYTFGDIPCTDGTVTIKWIMNGSPYVKDESGQSKGDALHWRSSFRFTNKENIAMRMGTLPGNIQPKFTNDYASAPIYRIGGTTFPFVQRRIPRSQRKKGGPGSTSHLPGSDLGTWSAGTKKTINLCVAVAGSDIENQFRFFKAKFPGGEPQGILLVKDGDKIVEEIPFAGDCGCGGAYGITLFIPSRVPSGKHQIAIRMNRLEMAGGRADYLYDVTIDNPDYGKDIIDPAYQELKKQFPSAKIASLRRLINNDQKYKAYQDEQVFGTSVWDNTMQPNNGHWAASMANFGTDKAMMIGTGPHYKGVARNLIKFDLSGVRKDTKILGAWIRTTISRHHHGKLKDGKLHYHAMRRHWYELPTADGVATWLGPDYKHARDKSKRRGFWGKEAADDTEKDRYAEVAGAANIGDFPLENEMFRFIASDITGIVQQWHNGEIENHGLIQIYEGSGYTDQSSSEFQDYIFRPTLVIAYEGSDPQDKWHKTLDTDYDASLAMAKKRDKPLMVKFHSPYCGACKKVANTTFKDKHVKSDMSKHFQLVTLTVEENGKLANRLGVGSVPAVIILDSQEAKELARCDSEILLDKAAFQKQYKSLIK